MSHYTIWGIRSGKTWSHVTIDGDSGQETTQNPIQIKRSGSEEENQFHWLAGLLEGEGSFLALPPSEPNQPRIALAMTDEDTIKRVATIFNVKYFTGRVKNPNHKIPYLVRLKGKRAVDLMRKLFPLMGERRQQQIGLALTKYRAQPHSRGEGNNLANIRLE